MALTARPANRFFRQLRIYSARGWAVKGACVKRESLPRAGRRAAQRKTEPLLQALSRLFEPNPRLPTASPAGAAMIGSRRL